MQDRIYLDYNATTPLSSEIRSNWNELFDLYGNPSSIHHDSRLPKYWLRETRQRLAKHLGCSSLEIIFNSGASEGNNTVLKNTFLNRTDLNRNEIIISAVEHPSVMKTADYLAQEKGAIVHKIPVSKNGELDLKYFYKVLSEKTLLVSVMMANNETGHIFPISEIVQAAKKYGALVHSDSVQSLGKLKINLSELGLDYATFSAHKFYALKGCGFIFARKGSPWTPLIHGGGQERSRRGGTENVLGIAALGLAFESYSQLDEKIENMKNLRDYFEKTVRQKISSIIVTGELGKRLPNTSSLIIEGVDGETLLMSLDLRGFSVSTGAACSSGNPEPSPVLLAMGLTRDEAQSSLRVSLGWSTTLSQMDSFIDHLSEVVEKLRLIKLKNHHQEASL